MKYVIYILLLFSLQSFGQTTVDSSKLYSYGLQIRANDLENIYPILASSETYEDFFDLVKSKYNPTTPAGTSLVTLDSVRNDALIGVYTYLKQLQDGLTGAYSGRIKTVLKTAPTSGYVIRQVTALDAIWDTQRNAVQADGQRRYKKQRN
jgi:hypothetical protein